VIVSFLPAELSRWDQLEGAQIPDALVLPFFSDERPLRGAAGLVDWRLGGRLSRMLQSGRVRGERGEATLYPPPGSPRRVPFPRLLLFGLGPQAQADDHEPARALARVLADLGLRRVAVVPPGRSTGRLGARRALANLLEALAAPSPAPPLAAPLAGPLAAPLEELIVVESAAGMKEAADLAKSLPA
jgi:hypothetical protein